MVLSGLSPIGGMNDSRCGMIHCENAFKVFHLPLSTCFTLLFTSNAMILIVMLFMDPLRWWAIAWVCQMRVDLRADSPNQLSWLTHLVEWRNAQEKHL